MSASKAKSLGGRVKTLATLRPRDFVPVTPAIAERLALSPKTVRNYISNIFSKVNTRLSTADRAIS